ncbi:MAG: hypothetical protein JWQ89_3626 [Devosia sp.]|uniref:hypothetical protein n=1 Tax=Devosia sp. TaxID=1871048 RepID=UPI00262B9547|nr:hypothetical protein [Devosia sp.]MDB5541899.1 hypothetical protein [Devosia sp.]
MSIATLQRRLNNLKGTGMDTTAMLIALEDAGQRAKAWHRTGNAGSPPMAPMPPLPPDANRADREMHDRLTAARARVERCRVEGCA